MSITKIDAGLPVSTKIEKINSQTLELDGKNAQAKFNKLEIDALYSGAGMGRKFTRDFSLSQSTGAGAWYHWKHIRAEAGYSIWQFNQNIDYEYNANNEMYFDDKLIDNKGDATAEDITDFDTVYVYSGSYVDRTSEAATEGGTAFTLLTAAADYIYIGNDTTFSGIRFKFNVRGSGHALKIEYSLGSSAWTQLSSLDNSLIDNTSNFRRDGSIIFTIPTNWNQNSVNGVARYWLRISSTSTPTTDATAYCILPYNSVATLLSLSSAQAVDEDWAFCSYDMPGTGARLYTTFRNAGNTAYEGSYYVTSASSIVNKQNFFRANHTIKVSYQNDDYQFTGSGINIPGNIITQGNVGIGTTLGLDYDERFNVVGNARLFSDTAGAAIDLYFDSMGISDGTETAAIKFRISDDSSSARNAGKIVFLPEQAWDGTEASRDSAISFYTTLNNAETEKVRITSGGNVGIGTTAPNTKLEVIVGDAATSGFRMIPSAGITSEGVDFYYNQSGDTTVYLDSRYDGAAAAMQFRLRTTGTPVAALTLKGSGYVGIGTTTPSAFLDVNSNIVRLRTAKTPASAADTGNAGDICWDANYIYVCTATDTWKRTALSTW